MAQRETIQQETIQQETTRQELPQPNGEAPRANLRLAIDGMHCANCAANIEKHYRATPGVVDVAVNLANNTGRVVFDPAQASVDAVSYTHLAAREYDFVVTTGGAANGDLDFIKQVVAELGALMMTTVNIRPGKAQTLSLIHI